MEGKQQKNCSLHNHLWQQHTSHLCEVGELGGGGKEGMNRAQGRREEGITVGIVHHVCMLLSLHTPHLYYWVTVELNSFVVPLWKQTVSCIMQFVDK